MECCWDRPSTIVIKVKCLPFWFGTSPVFDHLPFQFEFGSVYRETHTRIGNSVT